MGVEPCQFLSVSGRKDEAVSAGIGSQHFAERIEECFTTLAGKCRYRNDNFVRTDRPDCLEFVTTDRIELVPLVPYLDDRDDRRISLRALAQHAEIYLSPRLAAPAMGFCCYTFLYVAILTLLPPETPVTHRALIAAGMPLVSIAVSLTLGVRLLGRMSAVRLVQYGYAAAIPGFLLLWLFWGQGAGMVAGGFLLSAALGIVQGASFASIPELNATPDDRAAAAGAVAQLGNLGTTTGTPVLAALLASAGPAGLAGAAVTLCLAGIAIHALQKARRQRLV